jgi:integrase
MKISAKQKPIEHLTQTELRQLQDLDLQGSALEKVRDWFLFICYTGLSFIDLKNLSNGNLQTHQDGQLWLVGKRQKTKQRYKVKVIPQAYEILQVYRTLSLVRSHSVFQLISHQKINLGLKKIGQLGGIMKTISCHLGRRTFTTLALNAGIPIESVAISVGHANITQTLKSYAKVTDEKLDRDMGNLYKIA